MFTTTLEAFVSVATEGFKHSFIVFIPHGPLFDYPKLGQFFIALRCSMCAYTYGILIIHFYYRYLSVCKPNSLIHFFKLKHLSVVISLTFIYGSSWMIIIYFCLIPNDAMYEFINDDFITFYNHRSYDIPLIIAHYEFPINDGIAGILLATIITLLAVVIDAILAHKIHRTLKTKSISEKVKRLQKNVLAALLAQTIVPFVTTCIPCILVWYYPFLKLDLGIEVNSYIVPFLSAYPAIDPIVITLIITDYRNSFLSIFKPKVKTDTQQTSDIGRRRITVA